MSSNEHQLSLYLDVDPFFPLSYLGWYKQQTRHEQIECPRSCPRIHAREHCRNSSICREFAQAQWWFGTSSILIGGIAAGKRLLFDFLQLTAQIQKQGSESVLTNESMIRRRSLGGFHSTINNSIFSCVCSANRNALSIKFWRRWCWLLWNCSCIWVPLCLTSILPLLYIFLTRHSRPFGWQWQWRGSKSIPAQVPSTCSTGLGLGLFSVKCLPRTSKWS